MVCRVGGEGDVVVLERGGADENLQHLKKVKGVGLKEREDG